jgi:hypothetical protein
MSLKNGSKYLAKLSSIIMCIFSLGNVHCQSNKVSQHFDGWLSSFTGRRKRAPTMWSPDWLHVTATPLLPPQIGTLFIDLKTASREKGVCVWVCVCVCVGGDYPESGWCRENTPPPPHNEKNTRKIEFLVFHTWASCLDQSLYLNPTGNKANTTLYVSSWRWLSSGTLRHVVW